MSQPNQVSPTPSQYVQISGAATTTIFSGSGILDGVFVVTGGTASAITIYDSTAASGTIMLNAAATTTSNTGIATGTQGMGDGVLLKNGLTVVTTGTASVINVFYSTYIP